MRFCLSPRCLRAAGAAGPGVTLGLVGLEDSEIGKPWGPPLLLAFWDRRWGGYQSLAQHLAHGEHSKNIADAVKRLLLFSLYSCSSQSSPFCPSVVGCDSGPWTALSLTLPLVCSPAEMLPPPP